MAVILPEVTAPHVLQKSLWQRNGTSAEALSCLLCHQLDPNIQGSVWISFTITEKK